MKAKWLLAGAVLAVLAVAVAVGGTGAQPVPAPMPRKGGLSESIGPDVKKSESTGPAVKRSGEGTGDPSEATSSGRGESGEGGEVVESVLGEVGTWETVPGFAPPAGGKELSPEERQEALAREKEYAALKPIEEIEFKAPETVCSNDGRVQITATTAVPWRWNCQLIITLKNGSKARGTGWFAGPCLVMTAGHCVYSHAAGGWAQSIEVIPGKNGPSEPFGKQSSSNLRSVVGWTTSANHEYDYGAIILPNSTLGNKVGSFGFAALTDAQLNGLLVNTAGYPGDKAFGTQWFMADKITKVTARKLYYMIDTYGGQSGSAVWRLQNNQRHAVGIHAYGGCPNSATRITTDVFNNMVAWRNLCK